MGLKKILFGGLILANLLNGNIKAEEKKLEQKVLDFLKPEINFKLNFDSKLKDEDYSVSYALLDNSSDGTKDHYYLLREPSNMPFLTDEEVIQIENALLKIKEKDIKDINSYEDIIKNFNLSENAKITLMAAIGNMRYREYSIPDYTCTNIAYDTEKNLGSMGFNASSVLIRVPLGLHAINLIKTKEGTVALNEIKILMTKTKNIEKTLDAFKKSENTTSFQHIFFKNNEFMYKLIPEEGRRFLNFIDYDSSSKPSRNALLEPKNSESNLTITLEKEDFYSTSFDINFYGFFTKLGGIKNDISSPMMLFQSGYKRNFVIPKIICINPDINVLFGNSSNSKLSILSVGGDLTIATNNKKLNLSARIAGNSTISLPPIASCSIFNSLLLEGGISYKIPIKNFNITPYIITQLSMFPKNLSGNWEEQLKFSELRTGIKFDAEMPNNLNFSIESYYLKKIWEQGLGLDTTFKTDNFELDIGGYATKSNYDFCPDKWGFDIGVNSTFEHVSVGVGYKGDWTNYDGEIDNKSSLEVKANIKF